MKKFLLLAASAALVTSMAKADDATATPTVYPGLTIEDISSNGEWGVSKDPFTMMLTIINLKTGQTWDYGDETGMENYAGGMCHYVSDNGVIVGTLNDAAGMYWADGQWNMLPSKETDMAVYPQTITPDGSVVAGNVSRSAISTEEASDVMTKPVVWYRNADGTYGDYVELPYPTTDITGRVPQYVLIDAISADGKTCAGCVTDYSGYIQEPIVFTQKENGEWEYAIVHQELLNPNHVEFPPYPGEAPHAPDPKDWMTAANADKYDEAMEAYNNRAFPQMVDFMSADALAAYQEAYNKYMEDPYNNPYPNMRDYMTDEELAAYNNAVNDYYNAPQPNPAEYMSDNQIIMYNMAVERYNNAVTKWNAEYNAFQEAFDQLVGNPDIPNFSMNSAFISPNGKYMGMTAEIYYEDPSSWTGVSSMAVPYIFDLDSNSYYVMDKGQDNVLAVQVSDNGWVLGANPMGDYTRKAYLAKGLEAGFQQLIDVVGEQDAELHTWMKDNMTHAVEVVDYVYNEETGEMDPVVTVQDQVCEGTTHASSDFSIFAGWVLNNWDSMDENTTYSYVYTVNGGITGINAVAGKATDFNVNARRDGILNITGAVANVTVYDVTGRKVYSVDAPASQISTGLTTGTYVVTAKAADGQMITKKVAF